MVITKKAYPRAGLIGNPSDGYFGKTIAFTFSNFAAEVTIFESPELEILPNTRDHSVFNSVSELAEDVNLYGYYGGLRLLKAAVKRFHDYCEEAGIKLDDKNFTIRYSSDIPHMVGLAGSSAIITACFRAMMEFYGVVIAPPTLANIILAVEKEELRISAGLQDRVAQVYQGTVYMDFDEKLMSERGYGQYEVLDTSLLPDLYIAYRADLSEGSEIVHNDMREKYNRKDEGVLSAIDIWSSLTEKVRDAIVAGAADDIGSLLDHNFDERTKVQKVSAENVSMVEAARSCGCSAKFTGSGGAIIGTLPVGGSIDELKASMAAQGVEVIKPDFVSAIEEGMG
jgi:glucuronokinase